MQLVTTIYTLYCACKKTFYNGIFSVFRVATEVAILFYLTLGLYCQLRYGKVSPEQYFALNNDAWFLV